MLVLLFLLIYLYESSLPFVVSGMRQTSFSYTSFNPESCNNGTLICMGSVSGGDGYLKLTKEPSPYNSTVAQVLTVNQIGRVLYHKPVHAWPAIFTTKFTVRISPFQNSTSSGDGMTFIMAQDNRSSPPLSFGSYLGIMDKSTEGGVVRQMAVELDTYANEFDIDGNHIGIDTTRIITPVAAKSLNSTGIDLKSGLEIQVQISYSSLSKMLQISVAYKGNPLVSFLNHSIDLSATVPSAVYVGFTASTGPSAETHEVLDWSFQSISLPNSSKKEKERRLGTILIIVIPLVGLLVMAIFPAARRTLMKKKEMRRKESFMESQSKRRASVPKKFTYKQLSKATRKFSNKNLLGTGGFGSVYKGVISLDPLVLVAVKKISSTSRQGERGYLAEICTIGRLRHKNIVQLQGWCHEGGRLLLVYEYMANGSLDHYIGNHFLDWETRYKILTGLASALLYLHEECGNPVVHRDIKPNNVMLDSDFNAHLGDFGLARLLQNDASSTTVLGGTLGYLAPELGYTGKATPESDVYSFGLVVIEVVLGKRSKGMFEDNNLLDYVWYLYEKNALLEGVDCKLEGKYDQEQVKRALAVGLACLHPDPIMRPKIRKVEQVFLNPNEPLMEMPDSRPQAVFVLLACSSAADSDTTDFVSRRVEPSLGSSCSSASSRDRVLDEIVVQKEE